MFLSAVLDHDGRPLMQPMMHGHAATAAVSQGINLPGVSAN